VSSIISPFESEFSSNVAQLQEDAELVSIQCTHAENKAAVQAEEQAAHERRQHNRFGLKMIKERVEA
jgi:hypothetical protein